MTLLQGLTEDMKTAMRAREATRLETIRLLISAVKNQGIEARRDLTPEEEIDLLSTQAKRRRESIEAFSAGGREEMADRERAELVVIESYLPAQLTEAEVSTIIAEVIAAVGATSKKDKGRVMGQLMPKLKGKFPGPAINALVEAALPA